MAKGWQCWHTSLIHAGPEMIQISRDVNGRSETYIHEDLPSQCIAGVVAHAPCDDVLTSSACQTLERSRFGIRSSVSNPPTSIPIHSTRAAYGQWINPRKHQMQYRHTPQSRSKTGSLEPKQSHHVSGTPMVDQLAPLPRCFAKSQASALAPTAQVDLTHMIMCTDRMQLTAAMRLPGTWLGRVREVTFHSQEIIGDQVVDASRHAMNESWGVKRTRSVSLISTNTNRCAPSTRRHARTMSPAIKAHIEKGGQM